VPTPQLRKTKQPWLTSCPRCGALVVFEVWLVQAPRVMRYLADPPARLVAERLVHVPCTECVATVEIFLGPCMDSVTLGDEAAYRRFERRAMNPTFDGDVPWSHAITADGTEWWVLLSAGTVTSSISRVARSSPKARSGGSCAPSASASRPATRRRSTDGGMVE
jgi:hypothetical protein